MALVVKNLPAEAGDRRDTVSIPGLGRFPWRGAWQPSPVFCLGNPMAMGSQRVRHDYWSDSTRTSEGETQRDT